MLGGPRQLLSLPILKAGPGVFYYFCKVIVFIVVEYNDTNKSSVLGQLDGY